MSEMPSNGERGRLRADSPSMIERPSVPDWLQGHIGSGAWKLPDVVTGPDPDGGADFDDDEWAEFLAAVGVVVPRGEEERD